MKSNADEQTSTATVTIAPRLLGRRQAAQYLGGSEDTIDRLIQAGELSVVRLPVERSRHTGRGVPGVSRRILIDRVELDELIPRWRERGTKDGNAPDRSRRARGVNTPRAWRARSDEYQRSTSSGTPRPEQTDLTTAIAGK